MNQLPASTLIQEGLCNSLPFINMFEVLPGGDTVTEHNSSKICWGEIFPAEPAQAFCRQDILQPPALGQDWASYPTTTVFLSLLTEGDIATTVPSGLFNFALPANCYGGVYLFL